MLGIIIIYLAWLIIGSIFAMTALLEYFDYQFKFALVDKKWSRTDEILCCSKRMK